MMIVRTISRRRYTKPVGCLANWGMPSIRSTRVVLCRGRELFRAEIQKMVPYITRSILFMGENIINKRTEFCIVISRAYRGIGLSRFDKVSKVHVSLIRNFSKGGSTCIPRNLGFVRGPMRRRRRVWILGKVCECSLEAL